MKNTTELVFILDRSGSMAGLKSDTIGGFNSMLKKQQTETEGDVFVSTILFDHESLVLHDRLPLAEVKPLTEEDYEVRGSTALLDAIGDAVNHVKKVHKYISKYAGEDHLPQKTLFVTRRQLSRRQQGHRARLRSSKKDARPRYNFPTPSRLQIPISVGIFFYAKTPRRLAD